MAGLLGPLGVRRFTSSTIFDFQTVRDLAYTHTADLDPGQDVKKRMNKNVMAFGGVEPNWTASPFIRPVLAQEWQWLRITRRPSPDTGETVLRPPSRRAA